MRISNSLALGLLVALGSAGVTHAQDSQGQFHGAETDNSRGGSGLSLEFQGRLSLLSLWDAGGEIPRFIPPVTIGLRLLDQRLFLGVGVAWHREQDKVCPGGDADCVRDGNTSLFSIVPTVSFDILSRGPAHLYPLAMFHFGMVDTAIDNDFLFGMNLGLGLRGDLGEAVSIGSEWGYGFMRGGDNPGDAKIRYMGHGFWGTVNLSARIGL